MIEFMAKVVKWQLDRGRYFWFEHPSGADSWNLDSIRKLGSAEGVFAVVCHQCRYGLRSPDRKHKLRKSTRFLTNIPGAEHVLNKMCDEACRRTPPDVIRGFQRDARTGKQVKVSRWAQVYPEGLVRALATCVILAKRALQEADAPVGAFVAEGRADQQAHAVSADVLHKVQKIHENMGHCSNEKLVQVLKFGKAKPEFVDAAAVLRCTACERTRKPKVARPAKPPSTYEFNHTLGLDIFFVRGLKEKTKVPMLNVVCHGTSHQVVVPIPNRVSATIRKYYRAYWKRACGTPRIMIVDGERGFADGEFSQRAARDGIDLKVISASSPWQAGRTERLGAVWKDAFYRCRQSMPINTWDDFYELVDATNNAAGNCVRRGGFGAY